MALTKQVEIGSIEVVKLGKIQVREDTIILEDGIEISRKERRWTLRPGEDVTDQTEEVQAIASTVWTQKVIDAWNIFKANIK